MLEVLWGFPTYKGVCAGRVATQQLGAIGVVEHWVLEGPAATG